MEHLQNDRFCSGFYWLSRSASQGLAIQLPKCCESRESYTLLMMFNEDFDASAHPQ
jgi:hypothetical protein